MARKKDIKAIVLAAGEGTRMWPLTEHLPKHLLPLSRGRVIDHIIEALIKGGVTRIAVLVHWQKQRIIEYLSSKNYPVKVDLIEQKEMLGTANAISYAKRLVRAGDKFIAVNGDIIITAETIKAIYTGIQKADENTVAVVSATTKKDFERYGILDIVNRDGGAILKGIIEKPSKDEIKHLKRRREGVFVNAGVYAFSYDIFRYIEETPKSARGEYEITDSIILALNDGKKVAVERYRGEWLELTYPWDLLTANSVLMNSLNSNIKGVVEEGVVINGNAVIEEGAVLKRGTYIEGNVIIKRDARIGPNTYIRGNTIIGEGCHIGASVEIKNSIIMANTNVPHHNYVGDSIIGEGCNLGAGTKVANLRLDNREVKAVIKGKVVSTGLRKLGVIIGNNVKTGINASLLPGTIIGSGTYIGPGTIASGTLASNSRIH